MARAPFTFVVPDGAQPGEVIQVQVLGILARVKLPAGTFGGQQLTGTYSREAYGERWQAVLSDERETRRRRLESGLPIRRTESQLKNRGRKRASWCLSDMRVIAHSRT